jgi:hypothetical protein
MEGENLEEMKTREYQGHPILWFEDTNSTYMGLRGR